MHAKIESVFIRRLPNSARTHGEPIAQSVLCSCFDTTAERTLTPRKPSVTTSTSDTTPNFSRANLGTGFDLGCWGEVPTPSPNPSTGALAGLKLGIGLHALGGHLV